MLYCCYTSYFYQQFQLVFSWQSKLYFVILSSPQWWQLVLSKSSLMNTSFSINCLDYLCTCIILSSYTPTCLFQHFDLFCITKFNHRAHFTIEEFSVLRCNVNKQLVHAKIWNPQATLYWVSETFLVCGAN